MADLVKIKNELLEIRPDFEKLNLNGLNFFKEVEFACQIFAKNDYLAGANPQTKLDAVKNIAMLGISLNPILKYMYLIPRKIKINGQSILCCVAEPSYVGLVKILTDTGSVVAVSATIVYEKELPTLEIQEGAGGFARHKPYLIGDPGKIVACYAKAILPSGIEFIGLLREFEWENIKKRSESVKTYLAKKAKGDYAPDPTWLTDPQEMIRKTAIKNLYKYLPKTEQAEKIGQAIHLDNQANGINFDYEVDRPADINETLDTDYEEIVTENIPEEAVEAIKTADIAFLKAIWSRNPHLHEFPEFQKLIEKRRAELDLEKMQVQHGTKEEQKSTESETQPQS